MSWLTNNSDLSSELEKRLSSRIQAGAFRQEDIAYISQLSLFPVSDASGISPQQLENLRRLSEIFEIKFEPREITSHRRFYGSLIVFMKKILFRIFGSVLKDSFARQTKFNAEVVSFIAQLAASKNQDGVP